MNRNSVRPILLFVLVLILAFSLKPLSEALPVRALIANISQTQLVIFVIGSAAVFSLSDVVKVLLFGRHRNSSTRSPATPNQRTLRVLDFWSAFLPARISCEDLGDYLEDIAFRTKKGDSRWVIYLVATSAIFWTGLNALSYRLKAIRQKSST